MNLLKTNNEFSSDDVVLRATLSVKLEIAEIMVLYIINRKGFDLKIITDSILMNLSLQF